jgi:hypothetical protein
MLRYYFLLLLLTLSAVLRTGNVKSRCARLFWRIQPFLYPAAFLAAILLSYLGVDLLGWVGLSGLLFEFVCFLLRRRRDRR